MKNKSTVRPVLFSLLIIASLSAYIFVNYADLDAQPVVESEVAAQQEIQKEEFNENDDALFLLDVEMLKYLLKKTVSSIPVLDV